MFWIWIIVAALLYKPFCRWTATCQAPILSAIFWPLLSAFMLGALIFAIIKDKLGH